MKRKKYIHWISPLSDGTVAACGRTFRPRNCSPLITTCPRCRRKHQQYFTPISQCQKNKTKSGHRTDAKLDQFLETLAGHGVKDAYVVGDQPTKRPIEEIRQDIRNAQDQEDEPNKQC